MDVEESEEVSHCGVCEACAECKCEKCRKLRRYENLRRVVHMMFVFTVSTIIGGVIGKYYENHYVGAAAPAVLTALCGVGLLVLLDNAKRRERNLKDGISSLIDDYEKSEKDRKRLARLVEMHEEKANELH